MAADNRARGPTPHRRATLRRAGMRVARVVATIVVGSAVLVLVLAAGALVVAGARGGALRAPHGPVPPPFALSPPPLVRTSPVATPPSGGTPFVMVASLAAA